MIWLGGARRPAPLILCLDTLGKQIWKGRPNERGKHQDADTNSNDEANFVSASIASQSFGEHLGDTDTDSENSTLAPSRRYVWYCKLRTCPSYYSAWSCKSNFLLHLYETPQYREDPSINTREGRRQLGRSWREKMTYDLSELKKKPQELDNEGKGRNGA